MCAAAISGAKLGAERSLSLASAAAARSMAAHKDSTHRQVGIATGGCGAAGRVKPWRAGAAQPLAAGGAGTCGGAVP